MKSVMVETPVEILEDRRRRGLDRRDEVWEGVYHMVPPPTGEHEDVVGGLFSLFKTYSERHKLGRIRLNAGVRDVTLGEKNYRVPEWVFVRTGREGLLRGDSSYVDEGPDVILEVRSPGDETDEKMPFYEKVGVREEVLVDRDSRRVQVLRLVSGRLVPVSPNADGWVYCEGLRAFFKTGERGGKPALLVLTELDRSETAV